MKIKDIIPEYLRYLKTHGRAERTVKGARYDLNTFMKFMDEEKLSDLTDLNYDIIAEYQEDLAFRLTQKGTLLTLRSQSQFLSVVKGFTKFLKEKDYLLDDPGKRIKLPKKPKQLPKVILNKDEINHLINTPDTRTIRGYRNRVVLEILYDTAIRRSEISNIKLIDLDLDAGYIQVRGKGNKDRVVPLNRRVGELIQNYIKFVRPKYIKKEDDGYLILNRWGKRMNGGGIYDVIRRCCKLAGIEKNIGIHTFRHTCATHMLKNGAPIRHIQEMLGHESLESTQIYTRVTINDLKKVHSKYHPGNSAGNSAQV
jgi:integrase/recombinase XerD